MGAPEGEAKIPLESFSNYIRQGSSLLRGRETVIDGTSFDGPEAALSKSGRPRNWGLRLSKLDCFVIVFSVVATVALGSFTNGYSMIGMLVVTHFFLFCNVFRIPRTPELVWAGAFLTICLTLLICDVLHPLILSVAILPVTVMVLVHAIRLPSYHGVFARRLNPNLDDYLTGRND